MAKSNSNKQSYGLTLGYAGVETLEGILDSYNETGVSFSSRKPSSSNTLNQFYPAERVIACVGSVGGESQLTVYSDYIPLFRNGKRGKERPMQVTGVEPLGPHMLTTSSEDHKVIIVKAKMVKFTGEEKDENAPKRGRKAAGDEKPKKEKVKTEKKSKGTIQKKSDWP